MTDDSQPEEALFDAARRLTDLRQRNAFLDAACAGNPALRQQLEDLLAAQAEAQDLFRPLPKVHGSLAGPAPRQRASPKLGAEEPIGAVIGRYRLLERIGEGGFGIVYLAEQQEPLKRRVALKLIKPGMDSRQVLARFEAEQQALALMDHPNIAKVLDGGVTDGDKSEVRSAKSEGSPKSEAPVGSPRHLAEREAGREADSPLPSDGRGVGGEGVSPSPSPSRPLAPSPSRPPSGRPYFVMELVDGVPITEFCEKRELSLEQRLRLFLPVCQAVQHAHQKGIIHRDLKPSNVLVTLQDGVPVPKVIDFGVAKALNQRLTEKTLFTQHATLIGTPAYMSPEQAELSGLDVDTRSDIYSLGVLLYELLTGTQPFPEQRLRSVAFAEMQRIILHESPERPSSRVSRAALAAASPGARLPPSQTGRMSPPGMGGTGDSPVPSGDSLPGSSTGSRPTAIPASGPSLPNPSGQRPDATGQWPVPPRQTLVREWIAQLRGDLDWIVLRCLEKDRDRRYETTNALAADLQRHLLNEPVVARPPTTAYRLRKLVRRHRTASVAAVSILLAVTLGGVVSAWALWRERAARQAAAERLDAALAFVGQVLTNVAPGIQHLTGAARAQQDLGKAILGFARHLGAGAAGDPTVQVTLARALLLLGMAQNPGAANSVGEFESGLELVQEAVRLLAEPIPQLPEAERLILLLNARSAVALCLYGLGRWEEGIARSEELEPLFDQLEHVPERPRWVRREPWNVRANVGYSLLLAGYPEKAIQRLREVLRSDWFAQVGNDSPANEQELLANAHGNLAVALGLQNQFEAMLPHAIAGNRLWTNVVLREPQNARYQWGRVEGWSVLGWACVGAGRTNDGLALLERSRLESDALVEREPANDPFQQTRAVAATTRALAFAAWSVAARVSAADRQARLNRAEECLVEAEQLTKLTRSKEAEARLALARAGVEAIRRKLDSNEPGDRPR